MADSQPGSGNVQDDPGISCPTRNQRLLWFYLMDQLDEAPSSQRWDTLSLIRITMLLAKIKI